MKRTARPSSEGRKRSIYEQSARSTSQKLTHLPGPDEDEDEAALLTAAHKRNLECIKMLMEYRK